MAEYGRAELTTFYERHRALHESANWEGLVELFRSDGRYFDAWWGWSNGTEAIRAFLAESMAGLEDWTFPIRFVAIDGDRIVTHWYNRLPGTRPDGSYYETPGVSLITYDGDGLMSEQMDLYDTRAIATVMKEWSADRGDGSPA